MKCVSFATMSERPLLQPGSSPLLTDLYQFNMIEAYLAHGETETAVFELFVRKLPARRISDRGGT